MNNMPKYQLNYTTKKMYSEIVNLSGLIALILGFDLLLGNSIFAKLALKLV